MTERKQVVPLILPKKPPKKSVRLQLVVYPEVMEALREQKELTGRSVNDICNQIFKQVLGL
ncbi:MAG: hypothetical protein IKI30_00255 [Oxalobacter sp.]|nr:hypothetical protein [Oxalobacter sp.]